MRAISSSMDVHGIKYTDRMKRIQRAKKVIETKKKEQVTPVEHYESRGMTEEDKERKTSMTPQEAFRKEMAQRANSIVYAKLQNKSKEDKEDTAIETEQQESDR